MMRQKEQKKLNCGNIIAEIRKEKKIAIVENELRILATMLPQI